MSSPDSTGSPTVVPPFELMLGVVVDFDADRGLGTVRTTGANATVDFHCTAIVDGSRRIDPGTPVAFVVGPAGPGRWEARSVRRLDTADPSA